MAQTTFNLAVQNGDTQTGSTGSNGATLTSTPSAKTADTGFNTQESVESKDIISTISSPIVSSAFIFAGIILLLALVAKLRKNKHSSFKSSLARQHYTTRILGFAAFLMFAAGLGGTISRFMGVEATDIDFDGITTSGIVNASLAEIGDDYNLYCGTDLVTIKNATEAGYVLYAKSDNAGQLVAANSSIANIDSIEDWSTLSNGTWGFYTDQETYSEITEDGQYKPLHLGNGAIAKSYEATPAGEQIQVNYCVNLPRDAVESTYTSSISYGLIALTDENLAFVEGIDYDSTEDYDSDGLSNRKEAQYGTNVSINDTDLDGISDYSEITTYRTDPANRDTDQDGISDYSEIELDLNPNKADSRGDGVSDGNRTLSYTITDEESNVSMALTGSGDLPVSRIITNDDSTDVESSAINLYSLSTGATITGATITIPYNLTELAEEADSEIVEEELVIAKYDPTEDTLTTIPSTVDSTSHTVSAAINDLDAQYIIADKDTEAASDTVVENVYGITNNNDPEDDEILNDVQGGLLKKLVTKVVAKVQTAKKAQAEDCLTSSNGCDSGFRANPNGFAFTNFSTIDHNGVCAGMAVFAKLYYEGKITNGNYAYNELKKDINDEIIETTFSYNLDISGNLYNYTSNGIDVDKAKTDLLDKNTISAKGFEIIAENNQINGKNGVLVALDDARTAYGNLTSTYITLYQIRGLASLVPDGRVQRISTPEYISKMKNAFQNGRPLYSQFYGNFLGLPTAPFMSGHGIDIEAIKQKFADKITGLTTYEMSLYDNNYPGKDFKTTVICGDLIGCLAYPTFFREADYSILGSYFTIADTDDFVNIFTGSRDAEPYLQSYYSPKQTN